MEELNVEQTREATADSKPLQNAVCTGNGNQGEPTVSYGKFKDATALFNAYNALEAEFTKRCQRIKELEAQASAVDKDTSPTETVQPEEVKERQSVSDADKDNILKKYLKEVLAKRQSAIVLDGVGVGVKTPAERPKTLEQAGMLAKELFK